MLETIIELANLCKAIEFWIIDDYHYQAFFDDDIVNSENFDEIQNSANNFITYLHENCLNSYDDGSTAIFEFPKFDIITNLTEQEC